VTVHSLGAKDTGTGVAYLMDRKGKVLAKAEIPSLAAPADLLPKTAKVVLPLKKGAARVGIALGGSGQAVAEITQANNTVVLPGTALGPAIAIKPGRHHRARH
jgi:hypothetical protein